MDDMQNQMNAILGNPEMMQQIMAMAQSLKQSQPQKKEVHEEKPETTGLSFPDIDLSMVQKLSGLAAKTGIDSNQQTLLKALSPYLSRERINKLEKAMRAAKLASIASAVFGSSGFQLTSGR